MTMTDSQLKYAKDLQYALNQTKQTKSDKTEFWLWSDIATIHANMLDSNQLIIDNDYFHKTLYKNISKTCPELTLVYPEPIHIKTIYTNNENLENIFDKQITRLGCEYFFQKLYNTEFSQAYFLFPNATLSELIKHSDEISLYRVAKKIQTSAKVLSGMLISKTTDYDPNCSADYIWNTIWLEFFQTKDLQILKDKYNITNSPTTHMLPDQWIYVYYLLQDIINFVDPHTVLTIEEIAQQCRQSAKHAHDLFIKYTNHTPEYFLRHLN